MKKKLKKNDVFSKRLSKTKPAIYNQKIIKHFCK